MLNIIFRDGFFTSLSPSPARPCLLERVGCFIWIFLFSAHFVRSNLSTTLINRNKALRVNSPHIYSCIQSPFAPQFVCSLLNIKAYLDLSLVIVSVHIAITLNNQSCQKGNNFTSLPQRLVACLLIS